MASNSPARPSWQRGALFQFFASLKLAVVLLGVLIIASIAGTISESTFDAKVARAYIYGAPWFNFWLVLLAANLAVSALSRWPWRRHHVAFLITHLGIITLLAGSLIGRIWGIEGTMTLFKGESPNSRLLGDEHQLRVHDSDGFIKAYPAEFLHHPPTPQHPRSLGALASGAQLSIVDYAGAIDAKLNPKPLPGGGNPALHFTIKTAMMGQQLEGWLLADDQPQHAIYSLGLATIELKRGRVPAASNQSPGNAPVSGGSKPGETEIEETIFAFAKAPEQQIAHATKGGSSGARVTLTPPANDNQGEVIIALNGREQRIDVARNLHQEVPLENTALRARLENFWPDFRMENGKPISISDQPNNPAVIISLRGRAVPVAPAAAAHGSGDAPDTNAAPAMDANNAAQNHLMLYLGDDGALTYQLTSRKLGSSAGDLVLNKPLVTGWADWQLVIDRSLPHAQPWMDFTPATDKGDMPDGVRVRLQQNGETLEQWIPAGWQVDLPASTAPIHVSYGWRSIPLPIALQLLNFEVKRNEGSDAPAGFKSTLRVATADGESATGQCWMNNPFSFPSAWWRTWTGLTYKISQASWNPENLDQSTIQILRDPGWSLKWIGSVLIVTGVFLMFYVKRFRRPAAGSGVRETARPRSTAAVA